MSLTRSPFRNTLLLATVLTASPLLAQSVEGHIVNASNGVDLPAATVILRQVNGHREVPYRATADGQGRFRFDDLEEGTYIPTYRARGFWAPNFPGEGPPFHIAAGAPPLHLEIKMQPIPRISGRVRDAGGKPVPGASVWVLENGGRCTGDLCFTAIAQTQTDADGVYTVADLAFPGAYLVAAAAPPTWPAPPAPPDRHLAWAQTFFPDVADPRLAAKVIAKPAVDQWNVDIKLATVPAHTVRGKVLDPAGQPVAKAAVVLANGFGLAPRQDTRNDGTFEFSSVPDSAWELFAGVGHDADRLWAVRSLRVDGRDPDSVELRLAAQVPVHGRIAWDVPDGVSPPMENLPDIIIEYAAAVHSGDAPRPAVGVPDEKGGFVVELYPGLYRVSILERPPGAFYLDSIRLGTQDAIAGPVFFASDSQPVVVTYKYGGGSVHGTVANCGSAHVVLVPRSPVLRRPEFVRQSACGPNGQFEFQAVRPGDYYGVAVSADNSTNWWNALTDEAVLAHAAHVTVRANEHTAADLRLAAVQ